MIQPSPIFSEKTRLVYAKLDTTLPFDKKALAQMEKRRIIVRVKSVPRLRRQFEAAGKTAEDIEHLYAIPFRKPFDANEENRDVNETIHQRSIHTVNLPGRQFVFKGTGAHGQPISFAKSPSIITERRFYGSATLEGVKIAVDTLAALEQEYKKAKREKSPLVNWAVQHGVTELPVIKHAAVFKPLQLAAGKKIKRVDITKQQFEFMKLGEFFGQERVHAYTAQHPERIPEFHLDDARRAWIKKHMKVRDVELDAKRKLLKQFVARGLVLLHIADRRKIGLWQDMMGSPFASRNASPIEFFDFDTGYPHTVNDALEDKDKFGIMEFAKTISLFGQRLMGENWRTAFTDEETITGIRSALAYGRKGKIKEVDEIVNKIVYNNLW